MSQNDSKADEGKINLPKVEQLPLISQISNPASPEAIREHSDQKPSSSNQNLKVDKKPVLEYKVQEKSNAKGDGSSAKPKVQVLEYESPNSKASKQVDNPPSAKPFNLKVEEASAPLQGQQKVIPQAQ